MVEGWLMRGALEVDKPYLDSVNLKGNNPRSNEIAKEIQQIENNYSITGQKS